MRKAILTVIGFTVVATAIALAVQTESSLQRPPDGYTYDMSKVSLSVGSIKFNIPRAYISFDAKGGSKNFTIPIRAMLPNMSAISSQSSDCFAHQYACGLIVSIVIAAEAYPTGEQQLKNVLGKNEDLAMPQFNVVRHLRTVFGTGTEVFTRVGTDNAIHLVSCPAATGWNCLSEYPIGPDVFVHYTFFKTHMPTWDDMDGRIFRLVESFKNE